MSLEPAWPKHGQLIFSEFTDATKSTHGIKAGLACCHHRTGCVASCVHVPINDLRRSMKVCLYDLCKLFTPKTMGFKLDNDVQCWYSDVTATVEQFHRIGTFSGEKMPSSILMDQPCLIYFFWFISGPKKKNRLKTFLKTQCLVRRRHTKSSLNIKNNSTGDTQDTQEPHQHPNLLHSYTQQHVLPTYIIFRYFTRFTLTPVIM